MNYDFYEGCGKFECQWCNFIKDYVVVDSFVDLEIEVLDDQGVNVIWKNIFYYKSNLLVVN